MLLVFLFTPPLNTAFTKLPCYKKVISKSQNHKSMKTLYTHINTGYYLPVKIITDVNNL